MDKNKNENKNGNKNDNMINNLNNHLDDYNDKALKFEKFKLKLASCQTSLTKSYLNKYLVIHL